MSRSVWELHRPDVLDASTRLQRGGQPPEDEAQTRQEAGAGQEADEVREQRGQQRGHGARSPGHRSHRAGLPGGLPELLREEPEPGGAGHGGPGVSEGRQEERDAVGEGELPQAVPPVRPESGEEAHRGRQQLQLQVYLVLHGQV